MLAEMMPTTTSSHYGELNDYDGPPSSEQT